MLTPSPRVHHPRSFCSSPLSTGVEYVGTGANVGSAVAVSVGEGGGVSVAAGANTYGSGVFVNSGRSVQLEMSPWPRQFTFPRLSAAHESLACLPCPVNWLASATLSSLRRPVRMG